MAPSSAPTTPNPDPKLSIPSIGVLIVGFLGFMVCIYFSLLPCMFAVSNPNFSVNSASVTFLNNTDTNTDHAIVSLHVAFNLDIVHVPDYMGDETDDNTSICYDPFHITLFHAHKNLSSFTSAPFKRNPYITTHEVIHARFESMNVTFDARESDFNGTCGVAFIDFGMNGTIMYGEDTHYWDVTKGSCKKEQLKFCSNNTFSFLPSHHGCHTESAYDQWCMRVRLYGIIGLPLIVVVTAILVFCIELVFYSGVWSWCSCNCAKENKVNAVAMIEL